MINAGAKMTQMENRIVLARFKDGYGPVGAYFLHLKTYTQNALGEEYESKWFPALQKMVGKEYLDPEASHLTHRPIPTCLRNHCIISEVAAGRGPIHMHANPAWPAFYAVFVVAVAIHAPLGLRAIADEWLGLRGKVTDIALGLVALLLLAGGLYAVASLAG